jgi:hypothetical protein
LREDGLHVRVNDADPIEADLAGWDPATGIAVLRTRAKLDIAPPGIAGSEPRVGQIVLRWLVPGPMRSPPAPASSPS